LGAYQTGVVNARNLRRRGIQTSLADCDPAQTGFQTSINRALLCPNPDSEPDAWLAWMLAYASRFSSKPVLIASADVFVTAIGRFETALRERFLVSEGCRLAAELADKDTQYQLAAAHGMPMPRTCIVDSMSEAQHFAEQAEFPIVLKPLHFREWRRVPQDHPLHDRKVLILHDRKELVAGYDLAASASAKVVLQEIIQGPDTNKRVYLGHYGSDGVRTGFAVFRELRCSPVAFGPATVSESFPDPDAAAVCDRFLQRINFKGICEIELKRDSRSGEYLLIEANPRLSGGGDAGNHSGVDLAWLHYLNLIGVRHRPIVQEERRIRHIVVRADGAAAAQYVRAGALRWRDVVASYRPPVAFFDLNLASPIRSMRNIAGAIRDAIRVSLSPLDSGTLQSLRDAGAIPPEAETERGTVRHLPHQADHS
jgi:predicted ATP-grasp superfamily ATP-dependent carboligase